jgi:hypothetical protein
VIEDQFQLDQQHRFHAGAAEIGRVEFLDDLAKLEKVDMFFGAPRPVIPADERFKHVFILRRNNRRLVRPEHGIPFRADSVRRLRRRDRIMHNT